MVIIWKYIGLVTPVIYPEESRPPDSMHDTGTSLNNCAGEYYDLRDKADIARLFLRKLRL